MDELIRDPDVMLGLYIGVAAVVVGYFFGGISAALRNHRQARIMRKKMASLYSPKEFSEDIKKRAKKKRRYSR